MSKEENKSILSKLSVANIHLEKFNGQLIHQMANLQGDLELIIEWSYDIVHMEKDKLLLSAACKLGFSPESFFKMELIYAITCECREEVTQEEIETEIDKILTPCGEENTLITAFLSDKMAGAPLIVPPKVIIRPRKQNN